MSRKASPTIPALPGTRKKTTGKKNNGSQKRDRRAVMFPFKLHTMLEQAEKDGQSHIVSWLPDGKAFKVHKKEEFCKAIMPTWFSSDKYKTWQRSLNLWGFQSVVEGPTKGAYQHRAFLRGHPELCHNMPSPTVPALPGTGKETTRKPKHDRRAIQFPWKLHEMLEQAEKDGQSHIVSWLPDGTAFKVHKKEEFCKMIMPAWFSSDKYKTWQRSLNLWGFQSVVRGPNKGACQHRAFLRGHPDFCENMSRVKVKGSPLEATRESANTSPSALPPPNGAPTKPLDSAKTSNKPSLPEFRQSQASRYTAEIFLEAELKRRLSAQMTSYPFALMRLAQQSNFGPPQPVIPQDMARHWLDSQFAVGQFDNAVLGNFPFVHQNQTGPFLTAINTAAAALDVIRQEEAEILRRTRS